MKFSKTRASRTGWWCSVCLVWILLTATLRAQGVTTTTVQGTVYLANGQPASGTVQLSWPAFATATNQAVAAGRLNVAIGPDGFFSVNLAPNLGATPAGLYYTAVYHLSDGSTNTEYWVVPAASQAALSQVRAQVMPAAQAVQAVNKSYVDQSIAELTQSLLTASGGSLSGPLYLNGDPLQPTQAATKRYVDTEFGKALPMSGGAASGPLTALQLGGAFQVDQFDGADFGAKLQACVNALDSTYGGTCDARNFTGNVTISSNLTISTANATVQLPCATIATANPIQVSAGTRNVTLHGCALRGASDASGTAGGTVFLYSGSGSMIQVGDSTYASNTVGFHLDNVVINTTASASPTAQGFVAYRTQEMNLGSLYLLGNSNQTGMTLDGTGNYTGGTFQDIQVAGFGTAVNAIGHQTSNPATTDWVNASTFLRLHIDCPTSGGSPIAGTFGINLQRGDGNTFTGGDVEGCWTALHLGPNAQNNTIVGLRNENSSNQVVADAGSSYNSWITGGTMFTGQLTDNGTRNSFLDTFHRSFNGLNGDWYGNQKDATLTNHFRLGTGVGNERGLLNRYQTDFGYRWTTGLSDATGGAQFYQVLDELNSVYRLSIGQYNSGQSSTNNQTVINAAGTGAVVLNGSANAGTGGVVFGAGGSTGATVATINNAGNAQFNGTLQVGGPSTFSSSTTMKNQADAEIDSFLWAGATASQKESYTYKDYTGASQWYMVKDANNNWALNSATGGLDSFKAYQSTNSGDTYINASNGSGHIRLNYETGSGNETDIYSGSNTGLVAAFLGATAIKFPGLSASSGRNCLQIDNSGYISNTGTACATGGGSGTVGSGTTGQIAYYTGNGTAIAGTAAVAVSAGGTGASNAAQALQNLGAQQSLPGVTSDGASGLTIGGSVTAGAAAAGSVNGVSDLKVAFGASGSQQTMTCNVSGSNTLTGCSGGDFKVGSTVYIQAAGVSPTVSVPSAPTPTCNAYNGASCSGSVVYSYEVAAIQGAPNGAMTAASSAGVITQSAQTYPPFSGAPIPAITTSFTLPSATNVTLYAIYKSVNGGPYTFYTISPPGPFTDSGNHAAVIFTCVDLAVPCTAPSSATPNDVYAQITAINGSTVTIGALSAQPKYWYQAGLPAAAYPSSPTVSGTVIVQHDDTPALYAASAAFSNNTNSGQLQLHIPAGNYNLHAADPYGRGAAMHLNKIRNLTIAGDGDASKFYMSNDRGYAYANFLDSVCGYSTQEPPGSCSSFGGMGGSASGYAVADPVAAGSTTVTLADPANISNFTVGGYLTLYDPVTGYPQKMYGELNKIVGLNASTGQITLAYPANKYYSARLIQPYSQTCPLCAAAPVISPVIPGPTTTNLVLKDFWFRGPTVFLNYDVADWITETNLTIYTQTKVAEGVGRHHYIANENLTEDGYWSGESYFLGAAAGSADQAVSGSNYATAHLANSGQPCSEQSANIAWHNNTFTISGFGDGAGPNFMGGGAGCYGFDFSNNSLNITNSWIRNVFGSDTTAIAKYTNNLIYIDNVGMTAGSSVLQPIDSTSMSDTNITVNNTWKIGNGGSGAKVNGGNFTLPGFTSYTLPASSGSVAVYYGHYASETILNIPMSGNITSVNLGSTRVANLFFALNFQEPASGGPYTLPSDCTAAKWGVAIDCPNGVPPKALASASSNTLVWFWDDGTTVHYVGGNNPSTGMMGDWTNNGLSNGYAPIWNSATGKWTPGPVASSTAGLSDWSNAGAVVNYVATCKTASGGSCTSWVPAPGSGGGSGGSIVSHWQSGPLAASSKIAAVANVIVGGTVDIPAQITVSNICWNPGTADNNSSHHYDIGLATYPGGSLVLHLATTGNIFAPDTLSHCTAISGGPVTLQPGTYVAEMTTDCLSSCAALDQHAGYYHSLFVNTSGWGSTSSATLPANSTLPSVFPNTGYGPFWFSVY